MGATEEQMALVAGSGMDAVAYVLILYSLSFLLFLFVMILVNVYDRAANPLEPNKTRTANGHAVTARSEEEGLRDAGEFELEGLMSDEEDDEELASRRKLLRTDGQGRGHENDAAVLDSPSTTTGGRNNERLVS